MPSRLHLEILPQPDSTTCGPTCLHSVYSYFEDPLPLEEVVKDVAVLKGGGTLAVFLACHALRRGYQATIFTYNLQVFDPTWLTDPSVDIREKLVEQQRVKRKKILKTATQGYLEFLDLGGTLRFEDLTSSLIQQYLAAGIPILTGLSATYLYRCIREIGETCVDDDIRGKPAGHFVVLCGFDPFEETVRVADPLSPNPLSPDTHFYYLKVERVICSILLGILTYDANLLIIEPRS
ncbi:MAG: C39 family peptidase [Candidatus Omnitrophica bacterium]|nr:C39 family peptidase [Candidatus Omnitrophota bacterium]MCK6496440.1 C39 family peptidase [bacterium]